MVSSLLFAQMSEEFVPSSASIKAFAIGLMIVVVEFESARPKVIPCRESSREGSTGKKKEKDASKQGRSLVRRVGATKIVLYSPESTSIKVL
jgi:hypothetical protein